MKIEIKACAWLGGSLLFETEVGDGILPSLRVKAALEIAVKSGADLSGADLSGADLIGADLRGADLSGADLSGADLSGAYLIGADLRGADLSGADLIGADLRGAYLRGKTLAGRRPYLAIGPIGSREDFLYAYITTEGVFVEAGCFFGTVAEFSAQVKEHHGDNEHGQEYTAAVALIEIHAKLWTPTPEQLEEIKVEQAAREKEFEQRAAAFEAEAKKREVAR